MVKFLDLQKINECFEPELSHAATQTIASGWYLRGMETAAFEHSFAEYCHRRYCVGTANGLDALTLVLAARKKIAGWSDDSEVIVPAMTFVATAQAVVRAGLKPVFVDVDEHALIDSALLSKAITSRTRAIIPVHLYGQLVEMSEIWRIASSTGLFVLEDAAQAHGTAGKGPSHALAFSFYPGKNLGALGDAGAVVTDDLELAETVRAMANYGSRKKYYHETEGCNSRIDELQAAMLNVKLKRLDTDNERRRMVARLYTSELQKIENMGRGFRLLHPTAESVHHVYPVLCMEREKLKMHLEAQGIETLIHYPMPLHQQPCLARYHTSDKTFPKAEEIAASVLSLPISPILTEDEVYQVIHAVLSFYGL